MKALFHQLIKLVLAAALAAPVASFAAEKAPADHEVHHPAQVQAAKTPVKPTHDSLAQTQEKMHARMLAMQNTSDPQARQTMMMAQMQDMTDMMATMGAGCPMALGMGGGGMMGGGKGGMMGNSMPEKPAK